MRHYKRQNEHVHNNVHQAEIRTLSSRSPKIWMRSWTIVYWTRSGTTLLISVTSRGSHRLHSACETDNLPFNICLEGFPSNACVSLVSVDLKADVNLIFYIFKFRVFKPPHLQTPIRGRLLKLLHLCRHGNGGVITNDYTIIPTLLNFGYKFLW